MSKQNGLSQDQQQYPPPPGPPPPSYQQDAQYPQGQTYYQPPSQPAGNQAAPPQQPQAVARIAQFYNPPQNPRLGLMRKVSSCCCCLILLALIIGLATGMTRRTQNRGNYYYCKTNSECTSRFGSGVYCYNGVCSR
ncbi:hypothetical protein DM01DRAFT_1392499 [Hesseltinella vesiculosa]|uniref:Uncharacterized protein n=1 Tax=Hesseltinella vesiculosa TaxID=101127 RepID=A0A1X2GWE3_9FUNG|nr:hypothetical protein DM01DRAFT_1392499 [Hesseltinella vesiculosa]